MIVNETRTIDYADADAAFHIKMGVLARRLQEAAVRHSETVGVGSRHLAEAGHAWMLNRLGVEICRWPSYLEPLTVTTWHRGSRGFMAYRDFRLTIGDETVAVATSRWLFFDLSRKRVVKVPKDTADRYSVETDRATDMDLNAWSPPEAFEAAESRQITLRASDFDPNGHVNNAVYFDFLETLLAADGAPDGQPQGLIIQYQREIPRTVTAVTVGAAGGAGTRPFFIAGEGVTYAAGEFISG